MTLHAFQVIKDFVLSNHRSMKGKKETKPNKKRKKKIKERKQSFKLYSKPFVYGKTVALIFQAYPEFIPSRILVVSLMQLNLELKMTDLV